jgi:hypothetical protein
LPAGYVFNGPTISTISIDYTVGVNIGANVQLKIPQWVPLDNTYPPPFILLNEKQVYNDPYFYVHDISHFLAIISDAYKTLVPAALVFDFVYDPVTNSIQLLVDKNAFNPMSDLVQINPELNRLLAFKTVPAAQSGLFNIVFDGEKSFNSVDCYYVESRYISRLWVSFDTILLTTDLPLRSVEYQSNQSNGSKSSVSYKSVIFSLNNIESDINFYPFYSYTTSSTDKFLSFSQDVFNETVFNIEVFLFNKRLDISIPYKLKKDELMSMTWEIYKE